MTMIATTLLDLFVFVLKAAIVIAIMQGFILALIKEMTKVVTAGINFYFESKKKFIEGFEPNPEKGDHNLRFTAVKRPIN